MRIVVALGGNALLRRGEAPEAATQRRRLAPVARQIAALAASHEVLVVHGNGPQVGLLALESGADPTVSQPYPLGDLVAESQGLIGSWIHQALVSHGCDAAVLVTQVLVASDDPAFEAPTKPIGRTYDEETARGLAEERGWTVRPEGSGWRRVVASPRPVAVLDLEAARSLVRRGRVVVLGGGGGVPLVEDAYAPVEAVVDKDLVAALVADGVGADLLVVLTDVEGLMLDFASPAQRLVERITPEELARLELDAGSMAPKAEACGAFVRGGAGRRAVIAEWEGLADAVDGRAGTQVVSEQETESAGPLVLVIGLDPHRVPGPWDPEPVAAAIAAGMAELRHDGCRAEACLVGLDGSDDIEPRITEALRRRAWECVVVGGGLRTDEDSLPLFESVIAAVVRHAPGAAIVFNSGPSDLASAVERAVPRVRWRRTS